jgi:hypothetical protein
VGHPELEDAVRRIIMAAVVLVGLVSHAAVMAAQVAEVSPGARIRFRAPPVVATRITGTVLERRADTVLVAPEKGSPVTVPISAFTTLDISKGKSRAEGAKVGALWSAAVYALYAIAIASGGDPCDGRATCATTNDPTAGDLIALTAAGAGLGAGIGALIGREKWERVTLGGRTNGATR